jgi:hypothetical protein
MDHVLASKMEAILESLNVPSASLKKMMALQPPKHETFPLNIVWYLDTTLPDFLVLRRVQSSHKQKHDLKL